ncbi:hypothetical protein WICMUC_004475 [Wickerhamomyces mucosus]|uniref:C2H2-type domain-containing protein n=1 Tax=Wickerhamomyces mucosus TaxID=1378264 RepID=A0A9P8PGS8_9ASCO|nr:hypothetical protein WICMUC_004475 [Wickerhamomyces mucosus]
MPQELHSFLNLESKLSSYTIDDDNAVQSTDPSISSSVSEIESTPGSSFASPSLPISSNEGQDGVIHGHIHNFENFTYIHGHIHTNDSSSNSINVSNSSSKYNTIPKPTHIHKHSNDPHSSTFTDCQHFEFLNCHDNLDSGNLIIEDLNCDEDGNCNPKIMEICCDEVHSTDNSVINSSTNNFGPQTNNYVNDDSTISDFIPNYSNSNYTKNEAVNGCSFDECMDCDLGTCELDDFCKMCEEVGIPYTKANDQKDESQSSENIFKRPREQDEILSSTKQESYYNNHHHEHQHQHQHRNHSIFHAHPHSGNHHHHHIQLHDHQPKKFKFNNSNTEENTELINFSWNFKNESRICEWNDCGKILETPISLQSHIMENHLVSLPSSNLYHSHFDDLKHDQDGFECEWNNCDFLGDDLFQLINHINSEHSAKKDFNVKNEPSTEKYIVSLPSSKNHDHYNDNNNNNKKHSHVDIHHHNHSHNSSCIEEETICKWEFDGHQCGLKFKSGCELTDHILQDHIGSGKSEYICYWAGCTRNHKRFNQRQKIIRHLHVHTRYKPFKCHVCNHSFISESILDQHLRTHSGEKPFVCKVCGKSFARSSSLSIHNRIHTGEKPLVCKYPGCNKRFSESSNLTKHIKTHEKEYKCSHCLKSFTKEKQLQNHITKHHSDS